MKKFILSISLAICTVCLSCISAFALSNADMDNYNNVQYPLYVNNGGMNLSPQENVSDFGINPVSGNFSMKVTDITLPGKNGFDLNLTRVYNSQNANLREPYVATVDVTVPDTWYKIKGTKYYEYINVSNQKSYGYTQNVCIKKTYNPNASAKDRCQQMLGSNSYEYSNTATPQNSWLFQTQAAAQAMCNILNNAEPDFHALFPYDNYPYYEVDYYNFTPVAVSVQVPSTVSGVDILETTSLERYSKLGAGWEFDFPYIEVRYGYDDDYYYLHYGDKGTYEIDMSSSGGTSHLKGYPLNDIIISSDSSVTHDGLTSAYCVTEKNGKKSYFAQITSQKSGTASGRDGRLLVQRDRYGNEIKFYHDWDFYASPDLNQHRFPHLTSIVDSAGRTISFSYGGDYTSGSDRYQNITLSINDTTNSAENRQFIYKKQKLSKLFANGSGSSTQFEDEYILSSVTKPNGDADTY